MTIPLASMKQDFSGLMMDWAATVTITRFSSAVNTAGHLSGLFVTVASELMYIQAVGNREVNVRGEAGLMETHTHEGYQRFSGTRLRAEDRIAVPGDVYVYDVVHAEINDQHRISRLKQTKRS